METAAGESGILFQLRWKIKRIAYAVEESGTSLWHNILTSRIQPLAEVDTKPFCANETKQLRLITDFTWIPFEKLKNLHQDLYNIFIQSPYLDEQRCCALSQAFQERVANLQYLAAHRKK